ncbi:MAG: hypothetical protein PHG82_05140 [Candidatus Gracilibacteria bacterium]|nr:hypothetical protein [Candidatus Gracilibacteria bacterium]
MNINTLNNSNSRENLLELNYDKLYGVYQLISENDEEIELKLLDNCLVAFENQLDNLKGLNENKDVSILDLNSLTKGNIKTLAGANFEIKDSSKIVLASGGMIDFFESTGKEKHIHMLTSLRDAGRTSTNQRTTVAGRILGNDIKHDIEMETAEESPFLGFYNGEFHLAIPNDNFEALTHSIELFLETKYNPENRELKKIFERGFRGLKYEELGDVLKNIISNKRFFKYETEEINEIKGLEHMRKTVKIGNKQDNFYISYNENLNTYEFKIFKKFKSFPDGFTLPGKRPNRLFLESFNQSPRINRLENSTKINPSGAIKNFTIEINKNIDKILNFLK